MEPLLEKPPWLAVWDRHLRRLVRLTTRLGKLALVLQLAANDRSGEIQGASPLDDIFSKATRGTDLEAEDFLEVHSTPCKAIANPICSADHAVHGSLQA